MHLVVVVLCACPSVICSKKMQRREIVRWRRILQERGERPCSARPVQSGGLFQWRKRWQRVIIFFSQGRKHSATRCQNENASSSSKLNLCHGSRWPPRWWRFQGLKKRTFSSSRGPFLADLGSETCWWIVWKACHLFIYFFFSFEKSRKINGRKQIPKQRMKELTFGHECPLCVD